MEKRISMNLLWKDLLIITALTCGSTQVQAVEPIIELGAGYDHHIDEGTNPQSVIRFRLEWSNSPWVVEFNHHSSFANGWPFNDKPEDLVNQWSIIYRKNLKEFFK